MAETMRTMTGRALWAERIRTAYAQTVEAVFQVGRELLQAKQELPHGEFMVMLERELPFSYRTAHCYMSIAAAKHLQNCTIGAVLPASWRTLYELERLDPATFGAAVASGKIHPEMTRAEAEALLPARPPAPVVPMSEATRPGIKAALAEGGRMIAAYAERVAEEERSCDRADDQFPPSPSSIAVEAVTRDAMRHLRSLHALLKWETPKPEFHHRWGEAMRLAQAIVKQLEGLS